MTGVIGNEERDGKVLCEYGSCYCLGDCVCSCTFSFRIFVMQSETVTRFEVIDETGRAMVKYNVSVELSYQDDGRTLKIFLKEEDKQNELEL